MEHPPTSSAIADLRQCLADRDATIARLKEGKATLIRLVEDMSNEIVDRADENTKLQEALGIASKDRASIVAFLAAEAARIDRTAAVFDAALAPDSADRCRTKAGHTRTIAAQIERGDDRQGQDPPSDGDNDRFGAAADREVER